jgi:predicted CXXCH cytochrome family protein
VPLQRFGHEPFLQGDCMMCHEPHESDYSTLLRSAEGPALCFTCHQDMQQHMAGASNVHVPAGDDCAQCHDAHTSANRFQLHQPARQMCETCHSTVEGRINTSLVAHGALAAEGSCGNCHDAHAANQADLLAQREDRLCLSCHDRPITTAEGRTIANMTDRLDRRFLHGPIRNGECSACHSAHGADHANLLRTPFPPTFYAPFDLGDYALCFSCHEQELVTSETTVALTGFRDGPRNLHYVHVHRNEKGRTCKTCHDIHGSDLPNHVASTVPFEGSNWAMPIRFEKHDDGGRCTPGCHEMKTYRRSADRGEL